MRKFGLFIWLSILLSGIGMFFWYNDWVYRLPTPVPGNYKPIAIASTIELGKRSPGNTGKPVFLHFFNPGCPCSRFNISHFKSLVKRFSNEVDFIVVVLSDKIYTESEIQNKYELQLPVLFDSTIAATCGVYSTPQAAIIDTNQRLFYRGNYNRSRYCTDKGTEYARIALESCLNYKLPVSFDQLALKAYGCKIPQCNK